MTTTPRETRCTWIAPSEDPNARLLVPGCMERVLDWDAACTCKTSSVELNEAEARIADLERQLRRSRDDHHALVAAVGRHPDGTGLFAAADKLRAAWRQQTQQVVDRERWPQGRVDGG